MDYKELIGWLRRTVEYGDEEPREYCTNRCGRCEHCDQAATAIETLLAERDAAVKYIPRSCQTCKWWDIENGCVAPDNMGECLDLRELWQWRGPQKGSENDGQAR